MRYVRPYRGRLALVAVLSLTSTALSLMHPFLSKILEDEALIGRDVRVLAWTVLGFLALTGASLLLNVVSGLRHTREAADILFDVRFEVFRHLQTQSPRCFTRTPIGQVVYLVGSVVMLVLLDKRLYFVGLRALPAALLATVAYRRRLEGQVARVRDQSAGVGTFLIEALQGMKIATPARYPRAGAYATAYNVRYDAAAREYRIELHDFVSRP